ncbi:MAG: SpoIID/LytB domain-containing protein [Acidobacteriota bacterium]
MKKLIILYILFFLPFCAPLKKVKKEEEVLRAFPIRKPVIRVGLIDGTEKIEIQADSMRIWRNNGHFNLLALNAKNLIIATEVEKEKERYSIQLAAFTTRSKAEEFISKLKGIFIKEIFIEEDRVSKLFKIKAGYYSDRSEAEQDIKKAWNLKINDAWILHEKFSKEKTDVAFLYWEGKSEKLFKGNSLMMIPSSRNTSLKFNGNLYSGIFSIIHNKNGLTLVNTLNIDDYLKGVVPNELSPFNYPEIEALKAQAVAARTYALKNMGSFEMNGYDICASSSCQVYNGKSSENPLSSKAVDETIGEVAIYKNDLINALYTSTCGGATEDGENVFGGEEISYLKNVECSIENLNEYILRTSVPPLSIRLDERVITKEIARLISLEIIPMFSIFSSFEDEAKKDEIQEWISRLILFLGKKQKKISIEGDLNWVNFGVYLIKCLDWEKRPDLLLRKKEVEFLFKNTKVLSDEEKSVITYLVHEKILPALNESNYINTRIRRGDAALVVLNVINKLKPDLMEKGEIAKALSDSELEIEKESKKMKLKINPNVFLFRDINNELSPATSINLIGDERATWIEKNGELKYIEIIPSISSLLDRTSLYSRWIVRKSKNELERGIKKFYPIKELIDVAVKKRGSSNRVIELVVISSNEEILIKGYQIKAALGLRDTLFEIDREWNRDGKITHFTFSGRGWGHGVGMCQIGAFGMARNGANYKQILKKYYKNIEVKKIY